MSSNNNKIETHTKSKKDGALNNKTLDKINLDYDFNTDYGDGDIPDIDKPAASNKDSDFSI
ncbi:hypothetical protein [Clostridium sp. C105KSO13]|uniref:hypothetical protein n=1 Tax=Clostridium sp. C105KSO13 TaxID=1776045 RepID=UPI0007406BA1|nr:hypothetical protein [Clostridium sp. C105KSO13]CUX15149.1 hypothetical protein BN3456_00083 [Clostridium sp. C105KSO13]